MDTKINTIEELLEATGYNSEKDINWNEVSKSQMLSESFIEKYKKKIDWTDISIHQNLSEEFIEKYQKEVSWSHISKFQILSESFLEKYENKVFWYYLSERQILSEEFIEKYEDKVCWLKISIYQILSGPFIEKYKNEVSWYHIVKYQNLSEEFIEKFKDTVNWNSVAKFQTLSKSFIAKHKNRIFDDLYNKYNKSFFKKFDEMKRYAKTHNLYCDDHYIYGYVFFSKQNRLMGINKPFIYDKINYYYKLYTQELIRINNKSKCGCDKLVKVNFVKVSIDDWITHDNKLNCVYIKGFTIVSDIPEKQNINKYKLLDIQTI